MKASDSAPHDPTVRRQISPARQRPFDAENIPPTRAGRRVGPTDSELSGFDLPPSTLAAGANTATDLPAVPERFAIEHELGDGGMGRVMAARDGMLRRRVALKFLKFDEARLVERFIEEAQITAQLQHPNIVPIYDLARGPTAVSCWR